MTAKYPMPKALSALAISLGLLAGVSESAAAEVLYEQALRVSKMDIFLPVQCGGKIYPMIFDTGTGVRAFDLSLQSLLHTPLEAVRLADGGGTLDTSAWEAPAMAIGSWTLPSWMAVSIDFAPYRSVMGTDLSGMVGSEILRDGALELNYDEGQLRILRGYAAPSTAGPFVPGEMLEGMKFVPVEIGEFGLPVVQFNLWRWSKLPQNDFRGDALPCFCRFT